MGGIDHTIICFHNAKLMKSLTKKVGDDYIDLIPFDYNRDAKLIDFKFDKRVRDLSIAVNEGEIKKVENCLSYGLSEDDFEYYSRYMKDNLNIFTYESKNFNVIFYITDEDQYVMLGGYGHYLNPYTHFYDRGYGEGFERKMGKECYEWLMEDVLNDIISRTGIKYEENYDLIKSIRNKCNYKTYWEMTPEERENYNELDMIEVDEE